MGKVKEHWSIGPYNHLEELNEKTDTDYLLGAQQYQEFETAKRFNEGKPPMGYVPLDCLEGAARVMEKGAKKYSIGNYRKGYSDLMSPLSSLIRHTATLQRAIEAEDTDGKQGHLLDAESGEAHIHHVLTSAMILVQAMKLKGWKV